MAQFSKFILSCMIILGGASFSTSLYSMQTIKKDPLSSSSAGLRSRNSINDEQLKEARERQEEEDEIIRESIEYGPCITSAIGVGFVAACYLGYHGISYLVQNL